MNNIPDIPEYLLQIYKRTYENHYNIKLEDDEIVITTNTKDIYDLNIKNPIACS